jgi:integrase
MSRRTDLPRRVYEKHGAYYFVTMERKWLRLCSTKDGLPAMYRALADLTERERTSNFVPAVIARWIESKRAEWGAKTAVDQERIATKMASSFREFQPAQVTTPVCAEYLKQFAATPRTYNMHRSILRQVLAFAALEGLREGYNPIDNIQTKRTPGRRRLVTDDEIELLKVAALQAARNGQALVQMIDLALITGQRISDVIAWQWEDVHEDGLRVTQGKTKERLLIEWTRPLRRVVEACAEGREKEGPLLKTQSGLPYRYAGIRSAWVRACERAGIEDLNIHDLRGRAGVDKLQRDGLEGAKDLLGHRSIKMTEHYVDGKSERRVKSGRRR